MTYELLNFESSFLRSLNESASQDGCPDDSTATAGDSRWRAAELTRPAEQRNRLAEHFEFLDPAGDHDNESQSPIVNRIFSSSGAPGAHSTTDIRSSFALANPAVDRGDEGQRSGNRIARIVNGTRTNGFASVGKIGDQSGFFCTGTLIGSRYVLTAGHCAIGVGNTQGRFQVNGQNYSTSRVFIHPQYNDNTLDNDIAIYELNRDVLGVNPSQIFRGTPRVGQLLTLVGFGAGGTGTSGHNGDFGTKRVGTTPIDGVEPTLITWRFDNNSESNTAPGDSGGPAFITVNGTQYLAGVTSGGTRDDAGIGDQSFDTRVDAYQSWIDSIVGGSGGPVGGGDDHANAPGPDATRLNFNSNGLAVATGDLETESDRDVFRFVLNGQNRTLIKLTGIDDVDTYLRVYDSDRKLIAQNDDHGNSLNSQLNLNLGAGTYYVSAGSYEDSETGRFRVSVKQTAIQDDHGNTFKTSTLVNLNRPNKRIFGVAEQGNDVDVFRFRANDDGFMVVRSAARPGSGIDTFLRIYNSRGQRIAFNNNWRGSKDSRTRFAVNEGELYYVRLSTVGDTSGSYRLNLIQRPNQRSAARTGRQLNEPSSLQLPLSAANREACGLNLESRQSAQSISLDFGPSQSRQETGFAHLERNQRLPHSTDAGALACPAI